MSICLCMIVRDEAAVIERCLASVRGLIDSWVICDTGSQDGTPELIKRALGDLPGELHHREWRDFGSNRSELMEVAQGHGDYLLLLDADMTLEGPGLSVEGDRSVLASLSADAADAYLLRHARTPEYWIPRLVRGDRRWRYAGRTHEHLVTGDRDRVEKLPGLIINHHADSGTRSEKYERDLRLLSEDLREHPEDPRTVFYLAQTHRDGGDAEAAIALYDRRAAMGGWEEEAFYARFQAAVLRAERGQWPEALAGLIAAWEFRPTRLEPLYELASRLRLRGEHHSAYLFARRGIDQVPPPDILFVSTWMYSWGLLFEYSIAAYWVGEVTAALAACRRLLAMPDLPEIYRTHTVRNLEHCVRRAGLVRKVDGARPGTGSGRRPARGRATRRR